MKNIVGSPARRENFYQREREIRKIISRIEDGNNLHIAAPRRIGKTSILYHLLDNCIHDHIYVYVDTEAVNNEQHFFRKLIKEILHADEIKNDRKVMDFFQAGNKFLKKLKSIKIFGQGLDFHETDETVDYKEELTNLLAGIQLQDAKKLILLIDEFPQTIQNIINDNPGNNKLAIQFLQSNRELRLNPDINTKVIFIYTGSIGLNHTVSMIDGSAFINDLNALEIDTLSPEEAKDLVCKLFNAKKISISDDVAECIVRKVEWRIPFYIQLSVQEVSSLAYESMTITNELVDQAFHNIITDRHNNHFYDYYARLKKYFKSTDFDYVIELLCRAAANSTFSRSEAFDLSIKYQVQELWRQIIEKLVYDGYINNIGDKMVYRFNSPILKMWWERFICK